MTDIYKYLDLSLSSNDLPKSKKNTKSHLGTLISIIFFIYCIITTIIEIQNYSKSYKISFHELFTDYNDNEQVISFGFKIPYDIIKYVIYDSNNNVINDTIIKKCDENLNILKDGDVELNNYTCFVNQKFYGSNSTNHLIKIHFFFTDEIFNEEGKRYTLNIKFKEPIINNENYEPFIYPKDIKELNYFFDAGYITRYNKFIKLLKYETQKKLILEFEPRISESKFLEDIVDTSKLKENNKTNPFLGSFRLTLSKKKEIFLRLYPDVLSTIGGNISFAYTLIAIFYFISVRYIDNLRIYDSIKDEMNKRKLHELINQDDIKNKPYKDYNEEVCFCC